MSSTTSPSKKVKEEQPTDQSAVEDAEDQNNPEDGEEEQDSQPTKIGIEGQEIPLQSLSPQQLAQLAQQLKIELNALHQNLQQLSLAGERFRGSAECVQLLEKHATTSGGGAEGGASRKKLLVPLSQSVYVDGYVSKPDEVIVDVGTGYYCQKTVKQATAFLEGKVEMVQQNAAQVASLIKKKQQVIEECNAMLMRYQQQMAVSQQQEQVVAGGGGGGPAA